MAHQTAIEYFPVTDFTITTGGQDLNASGEELSTCKLSIGAQNMLPGHTSEINKQFFDSEI